MRSGVVLIGSIWGQVGRLAIMMQPLGQGFFPSSWPIWGTEFGVLPVHGKRWARGQQGDLGGESSLGWVQVSMSRVAALASLKSTGRAMGEFCVPSAWASAAGEDQALLLPLPAFSLASASSLPVGAHLLISV